MEQQNTPEQWWNNWTLPGTPAEHPGTTEPYKTKNNCSVFKRKFKTQNLNFQLKVETLFIADINYLFICFSSFKIKQDQANQLSSAPPLKPLWFSDDHRSQIIYSNAPMGESNLTHQGWTITPVFSNNRKIVLERKHAYDYTVK